MGWGSGAMLMEDIIRKMNIKCNDLEKVEFYKGLIKSFKNHDCDTLDECLNIDTCFDKAYYEIHPDAL